MASPSTPPPGSDEDVTRAQANLNPLVAGQAVSLFGDYVAYVTLPLFVVQLTGSALDLGLTAASETLPMLLFGVLAGVWLDRRSVKRSLIFADITRAVAFGLLALAAGADVATPLMVFATAFVVGAMASVFDSGLQAFMPLALSESLLVVANARLQLVRTLAWTMGAAAGGVILQFAGPGPAFALNAATFVVSAIVLWSVQSIHDREVPTPEPVLASVRSGIAFLWSDLRLRWATLAGALANFVFAPLEITLALFGTEQLGLSEAGVGWLYATQALIGAGGAAIAPAVARRLRLGRTFVVGLALMALGFGIASQMSDFTAAIPIGLALVGVSWINVAVATLRQRLSPPELMGRVISASRTITWAGIPVGAALGGALGEVVGLRPLYVGAASGVMLVAALLTTTQLWRDPVSVTAEIPAG